MREPTEAKVSWSVLRGAWVWRHTLAYSGKLNPKKYLCGSGKIYPAKSDRANLAGVRKVFLDIAIEMNILRKPSHTNLYKNPSGPPRTASSRHSRD